MLKRKTHTHTRKSNLHFWEGVLIRKVRLMELPETKQKSLVVLDNSRMDPFLNCSRDGSFVLNTTYKREANGRKLDAFFCTQTNNDMGE